MDVDFSVEGDFRQVSIIAFAWLEGRRCGTLAGEVSLDGSLEFEMTRLKAASACRRELLQRRETIGRAEQPRLHQGPCLPCTKETFLHRYVDVLVQDLKWKISLQRTTSMSLPPTRGSSLAHPPMQPALPVLTASIKASLTALLTSNYYHRHPQSHRVQPWSALLVAAALVCSDYSLMTAVY